MLGGLYSRQASLRLKQPDEVTVVGVGGVGALVAMMLAMSGVKRLNLMDGDKTELHNFNRLPLPIEGNVGLPKTEVVQRWIASLRPECSVLTFGKADRLTLALTGGAIVDATDNLASQREIHKFASEAGRRYVRVGSDGTHVTVTSRPASWATSDNAEGYRITPSWIAPVAIAAGLAVVKLLYKLELDVIDYVTNFGGDR